MQPPPPGTLKHPGPGNVPLAPWYNLPPFPMVWGAGLYIAWCTVEEMLSMSN